MEFRDIFGLRAEVEVANGGRPFRLVYDPDRWSVRWHVRTSQERLPFWEVIERLADVIVEWELTREGEPMAHDEEALWAMPRRVVQEMHDAIFQAELGPVIAAAADGEPELGTRNSEGKGKESGRPGTG